MRFLLLLLLPVLISGQDLSQFKSLKYRSVGPYRGGRVTTVVGVDSLPGTYYFGATGGGIWKTTDSGGNWESLSDGQPFGTGSVGSIDVAASDPNIVYAGMGEAPIRGNVTNGDGMYKSTDAGRTWKQIGLTETRQIARVRVHPKNPDIVYVAALGHVWGPNAERGIYRTRDGGKTWSQVFTRGPKAGAIDLTLDPSNPNVLWAGFWEVYRKPWTLESGGPGSGLAGIVAALDFLTVSNRQGMGDAVPSFDSGEMNALGKRVVVIGGGDTAMDCVRTAVRQGAASVTCLYRRDRANMPGSLREVRNAEEEGVVFDWLAAPEAFAGEDRVTAVLATRMHLGLPDASGRQSVEKLAGSGYAIEADLVIKALGFDPEDLPLAFGEPALAVSKWGTLRVDHRTFMTSLPGVFAAGDIVRGASLVVWAIRDGRDAAAQMHAYINQTAAMPIAAE